MDIALPALFVVIPTNTLNRAEAGHSQAIPMPTPHTGHATFTLDILPHPWHIEFVGWEWFPA